MDNFYSESAAVCKRNGINIVLDSSLMETKVKKGFSINEGMQSEEKYNLHDQNLDSLAGEADIGVMFYPTQSQIVRVVIGLCDNLHLHYMDQNATFLGKPWNVALEMLGLSVDQIW